MIVRKTLCIALLSLLPVAVAPTGAQAQTASGKPAAKTAKAKTEKCCAGKTANKTGKRDACAVAMTLQLEGVTCSGCAKHVTDALMAVNGVEEVNVSTEEQRAVVWVCPSKKVKPETLTAAVKKSGYKVVKVEAGAPKTDAPKPAVKS